MKNIIVFFLSLLFITACNKDEMTPNIVQSNVQGKLTINALVNPTMTIVNGRSMSVNADSFKIVIYNPAGIVIKSFDYFKDVPAEVDIDTGSYYVTANNTLYSAKFEAPYYFGQSIPFHVSIDDIVPVTINCELYNFLVTVQYTNKITDNFNDWQTVISNGEDSLVFTKNELKAGYFKVAPINIVSTLSYIKNDGSNATNTVKGVFDDPKKQTHYIITIDDPLLGTLKPIEINVNDSSIENVNISYSDNEANNVRYIKFESIYSQDHGQVNVYEIQAYKNGVNVALNKSGFANSYEGGSNWDFNGKNAVDSINYSRWSTDRNDGHTVMDSNDSTYWVSPTNPKYIVIDLENTYSLDSVVLNIEGFDHWKQTFNLLVSNDEQNWLTIGSGNQITGTFIYK